MFPMNVNINTKPIKYINTLLIGHITSAIEYTTASIINDIKSPIILFNFNSYKDIKIL